MTDSAEKIKSFSTHMRLLIERFHQQRQELEDTKAKLDASEQKCEELRLLLSAAENDYRNLKTARMLEVGDGDVQAARDRVAKLIRDVNKAITLLNGEMKAES